MKKTNAKSIIVKLTLEGQGVVNYGGASERQTLKNLKFKDAHIDYDVENHNACKFDVVSSTSIDNEGNEVVSYTRIPKISSDCLKNAMYRDLHNVNNFNRHYASQKSNALYLSSAEYICRGDMFPGMFGRKSAFVVLDAQLTNNAVVKIDTFSSSTPNDENNKDAGLSNGFFTKDTLGKTKWEAEIHINLEQLKAMQIDAFDGNPSLPYDIVESGLFDKAFVKNHKKYNGENLPYKRKLITKKNAQYQAVTALDKLVFDDEFVVDMVKDIIRRAMSISIERRDAIAYTTKVEFAYGTPIKNDGFVTITEDNIDDIDFTTDEFFAECSYDDMLAVRKEIEENKKSSAKRRADKKGENKGNGKGKGKGKGKDEENNDNVENE